jgi:AcrR family transcriptional regulator
MDTARMVKSRFQWSGSRIAPDGVIATVTDAGVHLTKVGAMADRLPQLLRADAEDNRKRVLDAARALLAEQGLDVPMREIARRAGVGPATLYRRFPTKQSLVAEAFTDELHACQSIVAEGCSDPDAWRGFCSVLVRIGELNARNHGFVDAFLSTYPSTADFTRHRLAMLHALAGLARRAKDAGELRPDFELDDLMLILMAGRGLSGVTEKSRVAAARRFAAIAIEGFRASGERSALPPVARMTPSVIPRRVRES